MLIILPQLFFFDPLPPMVREQRLSGAKKRVSCYVLSWCFQNLVEIDTAKEETEGSTVFSTCVFTSSASVSYISSYISR